MKGRRIDAAGWPHVKRAGWRAERSGGRSGGRAHWVAGPPGHRSSGRHLLAGLSAPEEAQRRRRACAPLGQTVRIAMAGSWWVLALHLLIVLSVECAAYRPEAGDSGRAEAPNERIDRLLVRTRSGVVRGLSTTTDQAVPVDVFLGIPFAKAPTGPLRFKKPVPIDPWPGILSADSPPNSCRQERTDVFTGFSGEEMWNPNTNLSEDCLHLNVWVPAKVRSAPAAAPKAPVLVWIYGGGYMSGTITLNVYDGLVLAGANDVIVVSINYRVGVFGFLYLDDPDEAPGNLGLYDQVLALEWIRDNIGAFGGDPKLITLFGESAGGGSISAHLLSPISRHLFKRGILQSGTINAPWSYMMGDVAKKISTDLVSDVGCDGSLVGVDNAKVMRCMRQVDAALLSTAQWKSYSGILGFPFTLTIDGVFLPKHPIQMLDDGNLTNIDLLIGSNLDEGTYWVLYEFIQYFNKDEPTFLDQDKFREIIDTIFKNASKLEKDAITFQYTNWDHIDNGYMNQKRIGEIVGDFFFICPSNYFAQRAAAGGLNVRYYYFTQRSSTSPWGQWMGVLHGDEIEYVFGHPTKKSSRHTAKEKELSFRFMKYFADFARTGKPASDALWPTYSRSQPQYFIVNAESQGLGRGPRASACAFWNEFMPHLTAMQTNSHQSLTISLTILIPLVNLHFLIDC